MLKDLVDLRKARWVARRETEKAKKLSDMRGEVRFDAPGNTTRAPTQAPQSPPPLPTTRCVLTRLEMLRARGVQTG